MVSSSLFYELNSKFQLWCHSKLIISFIYTSTQLSHSAKLWYHRALLIVCAYFEEFVIAYFKKSMVSSSLFYELNSKFQLWCHSKLIISFIYTSTQLSHSAKLWYHRALLIVCAYFEEFVIAYFKKSISCFKPINS